MKTAEKYNATTKLCSSYAWDTAINFIQKTVLNYATSSKQGNYDNTTFTYTDITGASQSKTSTLSVLIPTGETTPVCSIYDMGGNAWEWTTELNNTSESCTTRGGPYYCDYAGCPAGSREWNTSYSSEVGTVFRISLYM